MKNFIWLSLFILVSACHDDDEPAIVKMRINHYVEPHGPSGFSVYSYIVQEGNDIGTDRWTTYPSGIAGFEFEMGYVCDIMVKKKTLKNPPADGSSIKTTLLEMLSKEKVPANTTFEVRLSIARNGYFEPVVTGDMLSGFSLAHTQPFNCGDLCDELSQGLADELSLAGVFSYTPAGIRLIELKNE